MRRSCSLRPLQQLRQLRDVGGDATRLVARQQVGGSAPAGFLLEVHIGQRVAVVILDDEAGGVRSSMGPGRREAARRHGAGSEKAATPQDQA